MRICALLIMLLAGTGAQAAKPNIVFYFIDDLGWTDVSFMGSKYYETPHVDRLAKEGMVFMDAYACAPNCAPSRACLMSGLYGPRHGVFTVSNSDRGQSKFRKLVPVKNTTVLADRFETIAEVLQKAGYVTATMGKWHLGKDPTTQGFDVNIAGREWGSPSGGGYHSPYRYPNLVNPEKGEYLTDRLGVEASKFIEANQDKPFFLYLAHNMPHAPIFASKKFQGSSDGGRYGDVIEEIDWSVGRVMAALKLAKLDTNTLVIFTSDNGPWSMFGPHGGTAGPLRGEKGTSWEGGYRVPGIFHWPGKIKPATVPGMAANLDLYATFATLTGGQQPQELSGYQSLDLTETLLRGKPSPRTQWLFSGSAIAFRSGDYKIHLSTKDRSSNPDTRQREPATQHATPLLFNLSRDLGERTDLSARHPEIIQRLQTELKKF